MQYKTLQVGEVARQAGVSLRTVRYYEERGLLPLAERTSGGMRLYDQDDVARLKLITRLKALGLGLADIEAALGAPGADLAKTERVERTHDLLVMQRAASKSRSPPCRSCKARSTRHSKALPSVKAAPGPNVRRSVSI